MATLVISLQLARKLPGIESIGPSGKVQAIIWRSL